jgi:hypothetical protein
MRRRPPMSWYATTEVLTCLCARLSGRRPASRRAAWAVAVAAGRAGEQEAGRVEG